jgi:hypothetical protein
MKKAIFLGASNTHGVSLHYFRELYNDYENVNPEWPYPKNLEDELFIEANRFPKQLSTYLNVEEINLSRAGGSPAESLYLLSQTDLSDVEYIIFELSGFYNYFDRFFHPNKDEATSQMLPRTPSEIESFLTNNKNDNIELKNKIIEWVINYNPHEFMNEVFIKLKEFINTNPHIKFSILIWRDTLDFTNINLQFLEKYIVKFPLINDNDNILVEKYLIENKHRVCDEFKWANKIKLPKTMIDMHPSLNGHNKIFEILKSYIDERNTLNNWR